MTIEPIENGESGHSVRLKLNALIGNHWTNEEGAALRDDVQQQIAAVVQTAQAAEAAAEVAGTQAVAANTVATDLRDEFDALTVGFTGSLGDALDAIAAEAQAQLDNVSQQIQTDVSDLQATVTQDLAAVQGDLAAVQGSITQIQTQQAALDQLVSEGLGEVGSDIAGLRQDVDWSDLRVIEEEDATDRILELLTGLRLNIASTDARIRDAGIYVDPAAGTVRIRGLEATQERVSQAEIEVNGVKAEVALRATVAYVNQVVSNALLDPTQIPLLDDLDLRVTQAEVRIDGQDAVIALKADALAVNGIDTRLNAAEVEIDALQAEIQLRVTTAQFNDANTRLTAAEIVLNALDAPSIAATVSDYRGLSDSIDAGDFADLAGLLTAYEDREKTREAFAGAQQQLRAYVDEGFQAEASSRLTLAALVDEARATLQVEQIARASADEAISVQLTTLNSSLSGVTASLSQDFYTKAQTDQAVVAATTSLKSEIEGPGGSVGLLTATLTQDYYTKASTDQLISQARTTLASGLTEDMEEEGAALNLATLLRTYEDIEGQRQAIGFAQQQLRTFVEEGVSAEASARTQLAALLGDTRATLTQDYYTKSTTDQAISTATTSLKSQLEGPTGSIGQINANLSQNYYTKAGTDGAISTATTSLQSSINGVGASVASLSATLTQDYYTRVATDAAISSATTSLQSSINGVGASVASLSATLTQDYFTKTATNTAISAATTTLKSQLEGPTGSIGLVAANLSQNYYTKTAADTAIATATTALKSQLEGPTGSIGQINANLTQNYYTKTATDAAISALQTSLQSSINGVGASVASLSATLTQDYFTKTATNAAISSATTALKSQLESPSGSIGQINANLTQNYYTKTATDTAISSAATALKSQLEGPTGSIGQINANLTQNYLTSAQTSSAISAAVTSLNASLGTLSGSINDVRALDLTKLNGTAFGILMQNLGVTGNGASAFVTTIGTAVADLQNNASAGYLIKAQAGNAVSLLDLIAADGTDAPVSVAKISAADILLEGSVAASQLVITDFSGNLVPNPAFVFGDFRGWSSVPGSFAIVARGGSQSAQQNAPTKNVLRIDTDVSANRAAVLAAFAVEAGQTFRSRYQYATGGTSRDASVSMLFRWIDADDATISTSTVAVVSSTSNTAWATSPLGQIAAPTGAARVEVSLRRLAGGAGSVYLTNFEIIRQRAGSTLLTPNSITTDLVSTDSFVAWSTALFGGLMASTNYVPETSGWRININGDAEFGTLALRKNAITVPVRSYSPGYVEVTSDSSWKTVAEIVIRRQGVATEFMFTCSLDGYGSGAASFRLVRGSNTVVRSANAVTGDRGRQAQVAFAMIDWDTGTGLTRYRLQCKKTDPEYTAGWNANLRVFRRYFSAIQFRR